MTGLRRLGKIAKPISKDNNVSDEVSAKPNSEANITAGPKRCRPIHVTISNSYFLRKLLCTQSLFAELQISSLYQKVFVIYRSSIGKRYPS